MSQAVDFLEVVWGDQEGWVDVPSKVAGHWIPWSTEWPAKRSSLERRIRSCVEDEEDVYFSVAAFESRGRRIADTLPSAWLWADLDDVPPEAASAVGLEPTVVWESSPERFQALWLLDRSLSPRTLEKLNRALTYHLGADKGGWDLTQVLRVPGTRNWKYPGGPPVELMWADGPHYRVSDIARRVKDAVPAVVPHASGSPSHSRLDLAHLPGRARSLLRTPPDQVVPGERSSRLWELECLLLEAGCSVEQTFDLVWESSWNKWKDQHSGEQRLRRDIAKALAKVSSSRPSPTTTETSPKHSNGSAPAETQSVGRTASTPSPSQSAEIATRTSSPFVDYASFMAMNMEAPRWLVDEIWTAASHGIIGGEPKTNKSILALALALSVASGKDFLGHYNVATTGPVLMVQEENAPWVMQDRTRKIARSYGLIGSAEIEQVKAPRGAVGSQVTRLAFPKEVPLRFLNNRGLNLTVEEDREMVEREIAEQQPVMAIFDPLYLLLGSINENQSYQIRPVLQWLLYLRYTYNCAVILIHHWSKSNEFTAGKRPGQRLSGSGNFHGWVESAMYCTDTTTEDMPERQRSVRIEREFRNVGPRKPLSMTLQMGEPGSLDFEATVSDFSLTGELERLAAEVPGITAVAAGEALGLDKRTVLKRARGSESIRVVGGKKGRGHSWQLFPMAEGEGDDAS